MSEDFGKYLVLAIVLVVAVVAWRAFQMKAASPDWPWVMGEIVRAKPLPMSDNPFEQHHGTHKWDLDVRYRYSVLGQNYENGRIRAISPHYFDEQSALQALKDYPVGAQVKVYYDPARPDSSVLIPG